VRSHPAITAPIIGARNVEQLKASLAAADFELSAEMRDKISKLSTSPANATDRLEEEIDAKYKFRAK
jgi:aryl-alcohol dehydrogenase-like predicted oxidoreductase